MRHAARERTATERSGRLEFVVEDDTLDASALAANLRLDVSACAIDLGVVGQLARLPEARVERLPRLAGVLTPIRFE